MKYQTDENLLSQLADGELDGDQANEVLLEVLDDETLRGRLKAQLQLRRSLAPWRKQQPIRPVLALQTPAPKPKAAVGFWRLGSLAAAALIGGALVMAGSWIAGRSGRPDGSGKQQKIAVVSTETRREVAGAFALHESVAGPLKWYVADDQRIQLAAAQKAEATGRPIAVLLRVAPTGGRAKSYHVVCRNNQYAGVDLPASGGAAALRLRMMPTVQNGRVKVRYVIAMASAEGSGEGRAVLAGQRALGLKHTLLGQLVCNEQQFDIGASAWAIEDGS